MENPIYMYKRMHTLVDVHMHVLLILHVYAIFTKKIIKAPPEYKSIYPDILYNLFITQERIHSNFFIKQINDFRGKTCYMYMYMYMYMYTVFKYMRL